MHHGRNFNPEWGCVAPAPGFMRIALSIVVAAIIGATTGAATVFSLLDRPVAEESVAARTLVTPDSRRPLTASTSVATHQPTEPQQVELHGEADQKAPPAAGAAAPLRPSELATTSTLQRPTSAATLAEGPAVKETPPAQTSNDTGGVAPDPAPAPKLQSKKPRVTSRTAPRTDGSRYDARGYDRYFGEPRYEYQPRYGYEPRYGSKAWAPYY
jgi:hypothetical protein